MKLLMKASLVLAMGAVTMFTAPRKAEANCVVIRYLACNHDWEELCMQYCGVYDPGKAFCQAHDPADTLYCTGDIE